MYPLENGIYLNSFRSKILSALLSASLKSNDVNDAKACLQLIGAKPKLYYIPRGNVRASTSVVSTTQDLLKLIVQLPTRKRRWMDNRFA